MFAEDCSAPSLPSTSTNFMPPPEQTICMLPAFMAEEATAAPRNSANHASTRQAIGLDVLRKFITLLSHGSGNAADVRKWRFKFVLGCIDEPIGQTPKDFELAKSTSSVPMGFFVLDHEQT